MRRLGSLLGAWATRIESWWALGVLLAGAGVSAWLAIITEWLDQYGPIGWWAVVLLGVLVIALVLAALAKAADWWSRRRLSNAYADIPRTVNPLETNFTNQRIRLSDFDSPFSRIHKDKIFDGCEIFGPGVIFVHGHSTLAYCGFQNCDFVEITADVFQTKSAIIFEDVVIRNCNLYKITLLVPTSLRSILDSQIQGNWLD